MRGILLLRHGNTTYDDKVDALLDPPLNEEGVERIKRAARFLEDYQIGRIISSPRQRALRAAFIVSKGNIKITTSNAALPWNLGDLMGKSSAQVHDKIEYLKSYPDIRAPHGESYRAFYNRWEEFLRRLMLYAENFDSYLLVTTHSRNIDSLQEIIGGLPIGDFKPLTPEASVTLLANNGVSWDYKLIWDGR
jgi:broad specificity phosphatase PhoE